MHLPPSALEQRERLEQLRALEAGMRIDVAIVDSVPLGVDTPEDLERARAVRTLLTRRRSTTCAAEVAMTRCRRSGHGPASQENRIPG